MCEQCYTFSTFGRKCCSISILYIVNEVQVHSNISTSMQRIMIRKEHRIHIKHVEEVASVLCVSVDHVCKAIDSRHVIGTTREEKMLSLGMS